jgi:cytosine/adenosine deaminase-related metal-dependent hydrolase
VKDAWARVDAADGAPAARGGRPVGRSVVAHAPYSVSGDLFAAVAAAQRAAPLSVHLAESAEEVEFLQTGGGPFRQLLQDLRGWREDWQAPACDPVTYVGRSGYFTPGCLVVHGVHLSERELERLRRDQAVLVTCPRSNEWVGAGMPPASRFYASGVPVAIGTDSLASVATLNLFDELAALRRIAPEVAAASLLESATRIGAEALGLGDRFGTIAPGKDAALVAVRVPPGVTDVEEYLVGGVPPEDITPL